MTNIITKKAGYGNNFRFPAAAAGRKDGIICKTIRFITLRKGPTHMKMTVYCRMGNPGQEVYRFMLPWEGALPEEKDVREI